MTGGIKTVNFIGSGNVAWHLATALSARGVFIQNIYSPTAEHAQLLCKSTGAHYTASLQELAPADLTFICIKDDAIPTVVSELNDKKFALAHTSGTTPLSAMHHFRGGPVAVFYPLQSFRKDRPADWSAIPVCLEASDAGLMKELKILAGSLSGTVREVTSEDRKWLHLSAVFVSNFTNLLYSIGNEITDKKNLDFSLLHPLIAETAHRIQQERPENVQTGPAKRNDREIMASHLDMLKASPQLQDIYRQLSDLIRERYNS